MASDSQVFTITFRALALSFGLVFSLGAFCGYQFKTWRIEWLRRRRDRLARKIRETQNQIDSLQKNF